jgi:NADPH:quinone reductase-like Zn-dependent oxidoreductase
LPQSYLSVADAGEISLIGVMTRPDGDLSPYPLMFRGASMRGIFVGRTGREPYAALLKAIEQTGIEPVVDRRFAFDDARAAYECLAAAEHFGKIVIEN